MIKLELLTEQNMDAVRAIHREDIPESWVCPWCQLGKEVFEVLE